MENVTLKDGSEYDAQNADGTWIPKAYTVCLPYDFRFSELVEL